MIAVAREPIFFTRENLLPGVSRWLYIPPFAANQKADPKTVQDKSFFHFACTFLSFSLFILHFAHFSRIIRHERANRVARTLFELNLKSKYDPADTSGAL